MKGNAAAIEVLCLTCGHEHYVFDPCTTPPSRAGDRWVPGVWLAEPPRVRARRRRRAANRAVVLVAAAVVLWFAWLIGQLAALPAVIQ